VGGRRGGVQDAPTAQRLRTASDLVFGNVIGATHSSQPIEGDGLWQPLHIGQKGLCLPATRL
jgi:hypothetical protein